MTPRSRPFGWCAYHIHASDLHLIVTLTVLFGQAKAAGAMVGDGLSDRFAAALASAADAAGLPPASMLPVAYDTSRESIRRHTLGVLDEALRRGHSGLWLVLFAAPPSAGRESWDEVGLAWTHLTEHYPISALFISPFDQPGGSPHALLDRRHLYYYSAGQLLR